MKNLISIFKTPIIEFLIHPDDIEVFKKPVPAKKKIPQWFKDIPTHTNTGRDPYGAIPSTAKACLPLIDAMSLGFIIPMWCDVNIRSNKDCRLIEPSKPPYGGEAVSFHSVDQLGGKTSPTYPGPAIKWNSRVVIKTAPGWSVLITPCLNSDEKRFTCLSAVVDTDVYENYINFPAIWNVPDYDGIVAAGTPLVTVIPFKRSTMPTEAQTRAMTKKELKKLDTSRKIQSTRGHYYTKELREPR
jgi:hypothetical protein